MILSTNFLKDYLELDEDIDINELAEKMTSIGNEYDSAKKFIDAINLIIGKVTDCKDHPDSDHLHVCRVDIGSKVIQIVCGAPNVRKGLKVIVALDGAKLPEKEIKKSIIRGEESNGMICSIAELGLDNKFLTEADKEGIHELEEDAPIGGDPVKYLGWDDNVIDFELTTNRGDLLSILGMAYEVGTLYGKKVKQINLEHISYDKNGKAVDNKEKIKKANKEAKSEGNEKLNGELELIKSEDAPKLDFRLDINTENCSLFLARKVLNVQIAESPKEIKEKLMASGIRPINNVVDISNYVMLETGQPLHFYDADKLHNMIEVKMAKENEKLTTLDGQERTLTTDDIVISDGKRAIGLAGVMGGFDTEITESTKNVIIETAIFDNVKVRKTSNKILRSEASNRFEKGLDPNRTYMAMERACHLLEKYASGKVLDGISKYDKTNKESKKIDITVKNINEVLGTVIAKKDILDVFTKLGFEYEIKKDDEIITVIVPTRRIDISIKEDLIEEVGRIYGVDNIPGRNMILPVKKGTYDRTSREIRNKMFNLGLNETLTYVLVNEEESKMFTNKDKESIKILSPLTEEKSVLRQSVTTALYKTYNYNKSRSIDNVSLFELGKSFYKEDTDKKNKAIDSDNYVEEYKLACLMTGEYFTGLQTKNVDFYTIKGVTEEVLDYLGYNGRYSFVVDSSLKEDLHPGKSAMISVNNDKVGFIGRVNPTICKEEVYVMELNLDKLLAKQVGKMKYKEYSKFQSVKKDLAVVVDNKVEAQELQKVIKSNGGKLLLNSKIFDLYTGKGIPEGKKSIAFSVEIGANDRTLTDDEIVAVMTKITEGLEKKFNAELRS